MGDLCVRRSVRQRAAWTSFAVVAGVIAGLLCFSPAAAQAHDLYVDAAAQPGGNGSQQAPLNSLAAVEQASSVGDRIFIVPSAGVLDGGIRLKSQQSLIGLGPAVVGATAQLNALPAITNGGNGHLAGDAVRLADGVTVKNVAIRSAYRGGIYGLNTVGVNILGNDVTDQNTSCTKGFLVQPFNIPTGIPFIAIPATPIVAPQNGWAGIMVDANVTSGSVTINDNYVHDAECGDGIDIRGTGTSRLTATIEGNTVTRLKQGPNLGLVGSVLGIGLQALDTAVVRASQDRNTQTYIGSPDADCEGQFANTAGSGQIYNTINRNTFAHGIGGFSCNGLEAVISTGPGRIDVKLTNSTFADNVGDMIEEGNLGAGSTMNFAIDNVVVDGTSERGGNPPGSSDGGLNPIPFNIGDCIIAGNNGGSAKTTFTMSNSVLRGCNNGVSLFSNAGIANGFGTTDLLTATITNSEIVDNAKYGFHAATYSQVDRFDVKIERTEITRNAQPGASFEAPLANQFGGRFDLGGGALGGVGRNCLYGNGRADVEATNLKVVAKLNWWGHPGAPTSGQTTASWLLGKVTTDSGLASKPACGPAAG